MKNLLIILTVMFALMLSAFQSAKKPVEKGITITFTLDEINTVYNALGELPAKTSEALRAKIAFEYQKQTDTTKKK